MTVTEIAKSATATTARKITLSVVLAGLVAIGTTGGMLVNWAIDTEAKLTEAAEKDSVEAEWRQAVMTRLTRLERQRRFGISRADTASLTRVPEPQRGLFRRLIRKLF